LFIHATWQISRVPPKKLSTGVNRQILGSSYIRLAKNLGNRKIVMIDLFCSDPPPFTFFFPLSHPFLSFPSFLTLSPEIYTGSMGKCYNTPQHM